MMCYVDEIISFIFSKIGKFLMLIVSLEVGVKLLEEFSEENYGKVVINCGLSI